MKIVKGLIKEGRPKREIFERASSRGLDLVKVSKLLAVYPDPEESTKYNRANNILIGIYVLLLLFFLSVVVPMLSELPTAVMIGALAFGLLIPGSVLYFVYKKMVTGYFLLALFQVKGIFDAYIDYEIDPAGSLFGMVLGGFLLAYTVTLKTKLFPYQSFFNTDTNAAGIVIFTKDFDSKAEGGEEQNS